MSTWGRKHNCTSIVAKQHAIDWNALVARRKCFINKDIRCGNQGSDKSTVVKGELR